MASFTTLPLQISWATFLGLEDRILITGTDSLGNDQFQVLENQLSLQSNPQIDDESTSIISQMKKFAIVNKSPIPYCNITCCELGSIAKRNHSFVIFGKYNRNNRTSGISVGHIQSLLDNVGISIDNISENESFSQYTSVSFNLNHESFAIADDTGKVSIISADTFNQVLSFKADAAGINKVKYLRSGYLLTLGKSVGSSAVKLWDLRMPVSDDIFKTMKPCQEFNQADIKSTIGEYSAVCSHPSRDQIICGSTKGVISIFDMRSSAALNCHPHRKQVTDISIHPTNFDTIISSSVDGSIKTTNVENIMHYQSNSMGDGSSGSMCQVPSESIIEEVSGGAAMTCMDSIHGQNMHFPPLGLAGSSIGGLWTFPLKLTN